MARGKAGDLGCLCSLVGLITGTKRKCYRTIRPSCLNNRNLLVLDNLVWRIPMLGGLEKQRA